MKVTVRLFARARQIVGAPTVTIALPDRAVVADLRRQLVTQHAGLEALAPHLLFALGTDYVTDEAVLCEGSEIAVFPPVSGG